MSPLYCKVCRQIEPDLRFGVCFDCAEAAEESRERLERIESVQAPKFEEEEMKLDIEQISAAVHEKWMETKRANGVTSRKSESGEELMVPYEQLSEKAKDLDRGSVKAVLDVLPPMHCANPRCQSFGCAKHDEAQTEPASRLAEVTAERDALTEQIKHVRGHICHDHFTDMLICSCFELGDQADSHKCSWCNFGKEQARRVHAESQLRKEKDINKQAIDGLHSTNRTLRAELERLTSELTVAKDQAAKLDGLSEAQDQTITALTGERDALDKLLDQFDVPKKDSPDDEVELSLWGRVRKHHYTQAAALSQAQQALREIAEKDIVCECSHDTEDCCAKVGVFCAHCIAETALAALPSDTQGAQAQEVK